MKFLTKTLLIVIATMPFRTFAQDMSSGIIYDRSGLTIHKDGKVLADSNQWNKKTIGNREVYQYRLNGNTSQSVEVPKDLKGRVLGVKLSTGLFGPSDYRVYYLKNAILSIRGGKSIAYTKEYCDQLAQIKLEANKCLDLFKNIKAPAYQIPLNSDAVFSAGEIRKDLFELGGGGYSTVSIATAADRNMEEISNSFRMCATLNDYADKADPLVNIPQDNSNSKAVLGK